MNDDLDKQINESFEELISAIKPAPLTVKLENAFTAGMLIGAGFLATSAIFRLILVLFSYIINL